MDRGLYEYIWNNLQQGYSASSIKKGLLTQGYTDQQIQEVFSYLSQSGYLPHKEHFHLPKIVLFIGIALLVVGIVISGIVVFSSSSSTQNTDDQKNTFIPVETSRGSQEIQGSQTPTQNSDGRGSQTTQNTQTNQNNNANTGSSNSNDNINNNQVRSASPITSLDSLNQQASLSDFETLFKIEKEVERIAAQYPQDASALCSEILTTAAKDACYAKVAILSKTETYCTSVQNPATKDNCYIKFAIEGVGDHTLCENIQQKSLRSSCGSLYSLQQSEIVSLSEQEYLQQTTDTQYT